MLDIVPGIRGLRQQANLLSLPGIRWNALIVPLKIKQRRLVALLGARPSPLPESDRARVSGLVLRTPSPRTRAALCRLARGHLSEGRLDHGVEPVPARAPPRRRTGDVLDAETGLLGPGRHRLVRLSLERWAVLLSVPARRDHRPEDSAVRYTRKPPAAGKNRRQESVTGWVHPYPTDWNTELVSDPGICDSAKLTRWGRG